jgi:hypothetical protein
VSYANCESNLIQLTRRSMCVLDHIGDTLVQARLIKQTVKFMFDPVNDKSEILNLRNKVETINIYHE